MKLLTRTGVIALAIAGLLTIPSTGLADVKVQNAQYNVEKSALYVKGKLTGDGVIRVYVLDADRNLQIGTIETYARGQEFRADIPMTSADQVPCMIKVQTNPKWGGFFGSFAVASGEYTIVSVRHAPDRCSI